MSENNITEIDNWLRALGISDLALERMNLQQWSEVKAAYEELLADARKLRDALFPHKYCISFQEPYVGLILSNFDSKYPEVKE